MLPFFMSKLSGKRNALISDIRKLCRPRSIAISQVSPYGSECGAALLDPATGQLEMLRQERYQASFTGGDGLCLLSFDTEHMGYAALYGGGEQFFFADAAVFKSTGGDLYAISGAPYLMGVSGSSALYALDVRMADSMDSLICHELWHATENRILSQDYAAIDPDTWDALNPPGFTYCGDTALSNDLRQWTLYSCDPADVCFVDGYACVDAREDRARIMEYFMVHEDAAQLLIESPVIRRKLRLMCGAVRDNFDTTGWGQVRWESLL